MNEAKWKKIEEIFNEAISLPEGERDQFVRRSCLPDIALYDEVVSLISAETVESAFLNSTAFTLGAKVLSDHKLPETEIFADYRLIKLLGRGGMGLVFLAEDTRLKRLVAVKLLTSALLEGKDSELRFQQEAQAASHVSHQNIAHVYEYGEYAGQHFLAMEYVPGKTLREIIKEGSVNSEKAVDIVIQILEALSAAHRQGIVHRDIKPENIIVSEDGLVKVLDFGLAKQTVQVNFDKDTSKLAVVETIPGIIIGTAGYMSPEQIRGQSTDERTDLWSVGVVLYELLTGVRPFVGETPGDVHASILRDETPIDRKRSRSLRAMLKKALEKELDARFQTATEFCQELRAANPGFARKSFSPIYRLTRTPLRMMGFIGFAFVVTATALFFLNKVINRSVNKDGDQLNSVVASKVPKKITSLVVLPFTVKGDSDKNEMLDKLSYDWAFGLTDGIGSANVCLVKSVVNGYQMKDIANVSHIRNKLSVDAVLRGSITGSAGKILVKVELIDTEKDVILWTDEIESGERHLLGLRNRLFELIWKNLQVFLLQEKRAFPRLYVKDEAYMLYLKGSNLPFAATDDQEKGISYLQKAIEIEPGFSLAYLALAKRLRMENEIDWDSIETYASLASTNNEQNSSEAHRILGERYLIEGNWEKAFNEFKLARDANPNDEIVHNIFGQMILPSLGRFDEALSELETASKINPLSRYYERNKADIKFLMKDYEGALAECENYHNRYPESPLTYSLCKALPLVKLGRFDEACQAAEKGAESNNEEISNIVIQASVYAFSGKFDLAREFLNALEERKRLGNTNVLTYRLAAVYAIIGDRDNALRNLMEASQSKEKFHLLRLRFEPAFDGLRSDPEFVEIERRFTIPDQINLIL